MARRAGGPEQVRKLGGSPQAKERLEVILDTVAGRRSVEEACALLGVGPARFHEQRHQALAGALEQLEPRPTGRPPAAPEPSPETEALRDQLHALRIELEAARIREEIALAMPQLSRGGRKAPGGEGSGVKKTSRGSRGGSARRSGTP